MTADDASAQWRGGTAPEGANAVLLMLLLFNGASQMSEDQRASGSSLCNNRFLIAVMAAASG